MYSRELEPGGEKGGSINALRLAVLHGLAAAMDWAGNLGLGAHPLAPRPTTLAGARCHCSAAFSLLARAPVGIPCRRLVAGVSHCPWHRPVAVLRRRGFAVGRTTWVDTPAR